MWALLQVGFLSILAQVVLLRELSVASYGVELIYLLGLGLWLLATAAGAAAGAWRRRPSEGAVRTLLVAFGCLVALSLTFIRGARLLFSAIPGAYLPFAQQVLLATVALAPAGLLAGVMFQWAARLYIERGRGLAGAYGVECLGGLAGGLGATSLLSIGVRNIALAEACLAVALVSAALPPMRRRAGIGTALLLAALVVAAAGFPQAGRLDRWMTAWVHPGLLETRDLAYGRIAVARQQEQVSVFQNDALWFDTQDPASETFAHVVLLQHPDPGRILVLGGALEGLIGDALEHGPRLVHDVELDRSMFELVERSLPGEERSALRAAAVRTTFTDPRRFLRERRQYDVILVAAPEPISGEANRFYTREFFLDCAANLDKGGILGFRLRSAENFWTPALAGRTRSIHRALTVVFPHVVVLPGSQSLFVASGSPLPQEPAVLAERLGARAIQAQVVSPAYLRYLYSNDRRAQIARMLGEGDEPENTDVRPVCYQYAVIDWLSRFFPAVAAADLPDLGEFGTARWGLLAAAALLVVFGLSRRVPAWRRALLVAVAGFAGMALETVLILHFQMKNGVMFQDIGALLTSFMAGLAGGSLALDAVKRRCPRGGTAFRRWGAALVAGFVLAGALVSWLTSRGAGGGLPAIVILLGLTGLLVGALFAWVALQGETDQAGLVSPLYAADVLGGCAGSLLAGLMLIPMSGLSVTARWTAVLAALSAALL